MCHVYDQNHSKKSNSAIIPKDMFGGKKVYVLKRHRSQGEARWWQYHTLNWGFIKVERSMKYQSVSVQNTQAPASKLVS